MTIRQAIEYANTSTNIEAKGIIDGMYRKIDLPVQAMDGVYGEYEYTYNGQTKVGIITNPYFYVTIQGISASTVSREINVAGILIIVFYSIEEEDRDRLDINIEVAFVHGCSHSQIDLEYEIGEYTIRRHIEGKIYEAEIGM
jgi:hypothetical protein